MFYNYCYFDDIRKTKRHHIKIEVKLEVEEYLKNKNEKENK